MNSNSDTRDSVPVIFVSSVDFPKLKFYFLFNRIFFFLGRERARGKKWLPTEGKPTSPIRESPVLPTSNPSILPPPPLLAPSINSRLSLASFDFNTPRWVFVALFFWVRSISASTSAIFCWIVLLIEVVGENAKKVL